MNVRVRRRHQRDRGKGRRGSCGENRKRGRSRDDHVPIDDGNERSGLGANLRSFLKIDVAAAPKSFEDHMRREKNIRDGVFETDRRFMSDRRMNGEPRGGRDQRQRFAVGEFERLKENIDEPVDVAARRRPDVEDFDALGTPCRRERHAVDAQRLGEMRAYNFAALRRHRRKWIVESEKKRTRRRSGALERRSDRMPRRRSGDDDRAKRWRGKERRCRRRDECERNAERAQASSRALLPRRRLRRACPVR